MSEAADFFEKTFGAPLTIEGIIELFGGKRPLAEAMAEKRNTKVTSQMRNLQRYTTGATETRVPKEIREVLEAVGKEKAKEVNGDRILRDGLTVTRYRGDFLYDGRKQDKRDDRLIDYEVYIPPPTEENDELKQFVIEMREGNLDKASQWFNQAYFDAYAGSKGLVMHNVTQLHWRIGG